MRDEIKSRACGLFLYWHNKFGLEPNCIYHEYYLKLKNKKAEFPMNEYIKESFEMHDKIYTENPSMKKQSQVRDKCLT